MLLQAALLDMISLYIDTREKDLNFTACKKMTLRPTARREGRPGAVARGRASGVPEGVGGGSEERGVGHS